MRRLGLPILTIACLAANTVLSQELKLKVEVDQTLLMSGQKSAYFNVIEVLSGKLPSNRILVEFSKDFTSSHSLEMDEKYKLTFTTSKEPKANTVNRLHIVEGDEISSGTPTNWTVASVESFLDYSVVTYESLEEALKHPARVHKLNLNDKGLTNLPEDFVNLINLRTLALSRNKFTNIPQVLKSFPNLLSFSINDNQIKEIPIWMWDLYNLERLNLAQNPISDFPEGITRLKKLTYLGLFQCNLSNLPSDITTLANLEELDLHGNEISELPNGVEGWKSMKKLTLGNPFYGGNNLSTVPAKLGELKHLEVLTLSKNPIIDVPLAIIRLPKLETLWLDKSFDPEKVAKYKELNPNFMIMQY